MVEIPDEFMCSITTDMMIDLVAVSDQHSYDHAAIGLWLEDHDTTGSPLTGAVLPTKMLFSNFALWTSIRAFQGQ